MFWIGVLAGVVGTVLAAVGGVVIYIRRHPILP